MQRARGRVAGRIRCRQIRCQGFGSLEMGRSPPCSPDVPALHLSLTRTRAPHVRSTPGVPGVQNERFRTVPSTHARQSGPKNGELAIPESYPRYDRVGPIRTECLALLRQCTVRAQLTLQGPLHSLALSADRLHALHTLDLCRPTVHFMLRDLPDFVRASAGASKLLSVIAIPGGSRGGVAGHDAV